MVSGSRRQGGPGSRRAVAALCHAEHPANVTIATAADRCAPAIEGSSRARRQVGCRACPQHNSRRHRNAYLCYAWAVQHRPQLGTDWLGEGGAPGSWGAAAGRQAGGKRARVCALRCIGCAADTPKLRAGALHKHSRCRGDDGAAPQAALGCVGSTAEPPSCRLCTTACADVLMVLLAACTLLQGTPVSLTKSWHLLENTMPDKEQAGPPSSSQRQAPGPPPGSVEASAGLRVTIRTGYQGAAALRRRLRTSAGCGQRHAQPGSNPLLHKSGCRCSNRMHSSCALASEQGSVQVHVAVTAAAAGCPESGHRAPGPFRAA